MSPNPIENAAKRLFSGLHHLDAVQHAEGSSRLFVGSNYNPQLPLLVRLGLSVSLIGNDDVGLIGEVRVHFRQGVYDGVAVARGGQHIF